MQIPGIPVDQQRAEEKLTLFTDYHIFNMSIDEVDKRITKKMIKFNRISIDEEDRSDNNGLDDTIFGSFNPYLTNHIHDSFINEHTNADDNDSSSNVRTSNKYQSKVEFDTSTVNSKQLNILNQV